MNSEEKQEKKTEEPLLVVTETFEIGVQLDVGKTNAVRILLSPVTPAFLDTEEIGLRKIVNELVRRYNQLTPKWQLWQMLYKIHRKQSAGGDMYEMITQQQFDQNGGEETQQRFKEWMDDTQKSHPLPHKAQWYICSEKDKHFVWAVEGKERKEGEKLTGVNVETCKEVK